MKSSIPITIMLLFAFCALSLGLAFAEETKAAANETEINETLVNETAINATLENATLTNETLANASLTNETLANATVDNETLTNLTGLENETNPFENAKGRQVKPK